LKKLKTIPAVLCLCIAALSAVPCSADGGQMCHAVVEGAVLLYRGESAKRVPVEGRILRTAEAASGIYYCTGRGENGGGDLYIGFIELQSGSIGFERKLPVRGAERTVARLMAGDGAVYLLAVPLNEPGAPGELFRITAPPGEVTRVADILDFYTAGADCFMLSNTDSVPRVILNEISVPLALRGDVPLRIREVLDRRLVLVTSGEETEVIDIRTGKSLYQYATDYEFLEPDGYNVVIQAVDDRRAEQEEREMIFYKVIIDGVESGRTDSGPAGLAREMKLMLEPNRYHQVRLERWLLNPGKGRYDRENNIRQPKMKEIFIPLNRIVKLVVSFNNKEYSYTIAPVYK
jgi:hypothetical protein